MKITRFLFNPFVIVFLSLNFNSTVCLAGSFIERTERFGGFNEDEGRLVGRTCDGGCIIVGRTTSFGGGDSDVYLVKLNLRLEKEWSRTFGGRDNDYGYSVQQTCDGGYIAAGSTRSFGNGSYDVYLLKTSRSGDLEWSRTFGGRDNDYGRSVVRTRDGGYIIAGYTFSFGSGGSDIFIIKTNHEGRKQWAGTFGGAGNDYCYSVCQTVDGGYVAAGKADSFGSYDACLLKIDARGGKKWFRTFGGGENDCGYSVCQTCDRGYVISGWTNSFGNGSYDAYLVKANCKGEMLWSRTFGAIGNDYGYSVKQTRDGGYAMAGYTGSFQSGGTDASLIRTDNHGNKLWSRQFGGKGQDKAFSVKPLSLDKYYIAGSTRSFCACGSDLYFIEFSR